MELITGTSYDLILLDVCLPGLSGIRMCREMKMLRSPDVVTRSEIVEHVWSHGFDTNTNIAEVYINRLRQKIADKSIHTVRGVGYPLGLAEQP